MTEPLCECGHTRGYHIAFNSEGCVWNRIDNRGNVHYCRCRSYRATTQETLW